MARHMTFSDKVSAVADRMVRDADQRGDLHRFVYIGASGNVREAGPMKLSEALTLAQRFKAHGKIVGVDYIIPRVR